MNDEPHTLIGVRTAMISYAILAIIALLTLKHTALFLALLIVGALAVKTYIHHVRRHIE